MPYVHRTVVCGETVEHRKMYSSRVHSKEVKPRKRSSEKETSKCQERINERVAEEHLRWLINCNYHYGDFHLVLHYWCKTITLEQAERDRAAFFRELRKAYAKEGKRLKYIAVLETKHMTNVHHHILLPRFDAQIIAAESIMPMIVTMVLVLFFFRLSNVTLLKTFICGSPRLW